MAMFLITASRIFLTMRSQPARLCHTSVLRTVTLMQGRRPQRWNQRAFSLLELIVVVSIIATVAALSIPQFLRFSQASQLTGGANLVIDSLNLARQTAQTRNRPVEFR